MKDIAVFITLFFFSISAFSQDDFDCSADRACIEDSLQAARFLQPDKYATFLEKENIQFKDKKESPLTPKDRRKFKELSYYDYNPAFCVVAEMTIYDTPQPIDIVTTTPRKVNYVIYGELHFDLLGNDYVLQVYQNTDLVEEAGYEDYLFLPFKDLTNGETTYGGGRYIDFRIPKNKFGLTLLDFNFSYNPYCAYNYKYSCPIVPAENHLKVKIKAGVLNYEGQNH